MASAVSTKTFDFISRLPAEIAEDIMNQYIDSPKDRGRYAQTCRSLYLNRVQNVFGARFLEGIGNLTSYLSFPRHTLQDTAFMRNDHRIHQEVIPETAFKDSSGKNKSIVVTSDLQGGLGLAVRFEDGTNQSARVFHRRAFNGSNPMTSTQQLLFFGWVRGAYYDVFAKEYSHWEKESTTLLQMMRGEHLTTVIDLDGTETVKKTHRTYLQQRMCQDFSTALRFTRSAAFESSEVRACVAEYANGWSEEQISQYQEAMLRWESNLSSEMLSAIGGIFHAGAINAIVTHRGDVDESRPDDPYDSFSHTRSSRQLRTRDWVRSKDNVLVLERTHPTRAKEIYLVAFKFLEGNQKKVFVITTPQGDSEEQAYGKFLGGEASRAFLQREIVYLNESPDVVQSIMLGKHPQIELVE